MVLNFGILIAVVLAVGYLAMLRGGNVSGADARRLVASGALLVDVRTFEEFTSGHLPGAVNIPVQELDRRLGELGPKDRPIVLYCRSGNRSGRAARMLERAGFATIHHLGSIRRW